jgi:hypothetical protein
MRDINKYVNDEFYRKCSEAIPIIHFPSDWGVKIIPPFGGAVARFLISKDGATVSVYADFDSSLGYYVDRDGADMPYWEIYPYDEDVYRCDIDNVDDLMLRIGQSIRQQGS